MCAPFIKSDIIEKVLEDKKTSSLLEVITSSNIANFYAKASDTKVIQSLLDKQAKVKNFQQPHTKIYMFDETKAIITSANLTHSGLYTNYEYGVLLDNEKQLEDQMETDFVSMLQNDCCGDFSYNDISKTEEIIKKLGKEPKVINSQLEGVLLQVEDYDIIIHYLSGWKKDVFRCISTIKGNSFDLKDIYSFDSFLSQVHSGNHFIEAKIRQALQQLSTLSLIKLWILMGIIQRL